MYYKHMDELLEKLKKKIKNKFSRFQAVMKFDEVNLIKSTKKLYQELELLNIEAFLEIANKVYKEINPEGKGLDKKWLLLLLASYNPTMKYVYTYEVDRKSARTYEALLSTRKKKELITAFNLWYRQTLWFGIDVTDQAVIQAFKDNGVKKLKWNTQIDGRECTICRMRNGNIYSIDKLPPKVHPNCRCYWSEAK
ncbi:minor capsid protein [Methanobrevibacter sp.]|uniref:minor capsid protein n=1 Tax=Methanobrevibacter sp. TaxID=66852 RepID=UPI00388DC0CD